MKNWLDEDEVVFQRIDDPVYFAESRLEFENGHWALLLMRRHLHGSKAIDMRSSLMLHGTGPMSLSEVRRALYSLRHAKPLNDAN